MRSAWSLVGVFALALVMSGCAGTYTPVDLSQDLSAETLQRYEAKWEEMGKPGGMATLERCNWWPLGLLIYHRDAMVMRMEGPQGVVYEIMYGEGYGPLSMIYARSTHARFDAAGRRNDWMRMKTVPLGEIAMSHEHSTQLKDGHQEEGTSTHLLMHMINWERMDGHAYYSLLSLPNPLGISVTEHGAE